MLAKEKWSLGVHAPYHVHPIQCVCVCVGGGGGGGGGGGCSILTETLRGVFCSLYSAAKSV